MSHPLGHQTHTPRTALWLLVTVLCVFGWQANHAAWAANSFEVYSFKPSLFDTRAFSLTPADVLPRSQFLFSTHSDYHFKPFVAARATAGFKTNVVKHMSSLHLGLAYGLHERVSLAVGVPFVYWQDFRQIAWTTSDHKIGVGDVRVEALFRINAADTTAAASAVGLAIQPFLLIPTSFDEIYLSHGTLTGGLVAVVDKRFSSKLRATFNTGVHIKPKVTAGNAYSATDLMLSLALIYELGERACVFGEVQTRSVVDRLFQSSRNVILGLRSGVQFEIGPALKLHTTAGGHIFDGIGASLFNFDVGLTFRFPATKTPEPVPVPVVPPAPELQPVLPKPTPQSKPPAKRRFLPIV